MIVEEIRRVKRAEYQIVVAGNAYAATESMLADYHLYKGKVLTAEDLRAIEKCYVERSCYDKALQLVTRRDHYIKELQTKLYARQFSEESVQYAIDKLIENGYIDEWRYSKLLFEHYSRTDSLAKLKYRLYSKGCPSHLVDRVVSEMPFDEAANAFNSLQKKTSTMSLAKIEQSREKLLRFLIGRGFDYSLAKRSYNRLLEVKGDKLSP